MACVAASRPVPYSTVGTVAYGTTSLAMPAPAPQPSTQLMPHEAQNYNNYSAAGQHMYTQPQLVPQSQHQLTFGVFPYHMEQPPRHSQIIQAPFSLPISMQPMMQGVCVQGFPGHTISFAMPPHHHQQQQQPQLPQQPPVFQQSVQLRPMSGSPLTPIIPKMPIMGSLPPPIDPGPVFQLDSQQFRPLTPQSTVTSARPSSAVDGIPCSMPEEISQSQGISTIWTQTANSELPPELARARLSGSVSEDKSKAALPATQLCRVPLRLPAEAVSRREPIEPRAQASYSAPATASGLFPQVLLPHNRQQRTSVPELELSTRNSTPLNTPQNSPEIRNTVYENGKPDNSKCGDTLPTSTVSKSQFQLMQSSQPNSVVIEPRWHCDEQHLTCVPSTGRMGKQPVRDPEKLRHRIWLQQNRTHQDKLYAMGFRVQEGSNGTKICSVCKKSFTKEMFVWRHALHHINEKPFHCTVCNQKFTRSDTLQRHVRRTGHQLEETAA